MRNIAAALFIMILLLPNIASARWQGPQVVVSGIWGNDPGQFHIYYGESADYFPQQFFLDKAGNIVIPDNGNKRIAIYSEGKLKKLLTKPPELPAEDEMYDWPGEIVSYEGGDSIVIYCRYEKIPGGIKPSKRCFLDYDGRLLAEGPMAYVVAIPTGYILRTKDRSYLYSPTGKMIEERPAALIINSYLEDEYGGFAEFKEKKDKQWKKCTKALESLILPKNESNGFPEYGRRIVTSNCDVYLWKRTSEAYSILKWSWLDKQK